MSRFSTAITLLALVCLVSGGAVAPVLALAQPPDTAGEEPATALQVGQPTNETDSNSIANASDPPTGHWLSNGTNTSADGGGSFPGLGVSSGFGIGNGQTMMDDIVEWIQETAVDVISGLLGGTMHLLIGTPVPDNSGWMGIFGTPTNHPYQSIHEPIYENQVFPFALAILVLAMILLTGFLPYSSIIGSYRAYLWILRTLVAIFALIFAWPLATWLHLIANNVAHAFAPDPRAIITSFEGALTMGTTAVPIAATIYLFGWMKVAIYAFIYLFRYQLLFWAPYALGPLLVLALIGPHKKLRHFASFGLWQYVGLLIMTWPNALLFGAAYELGWSFSSDALVNVGLIMGMFLTGIFLPLFIMYAMSHGPGLISGMATGIATSAAHGVSRRSEQGWRPETPRRAWQGAKRARAGARTTVERTRERLSAARERFPSRRRLATDGGTDTAKSSSSSSSSKEIKERDRARDADDSNHISPQERRNHAKEQRRKRQAKNWKGGA
ncbi:hypothetical protein [Halegenticoccus tardaugens]|uniref:hypothetical protein n=1 Tax=Halegenticoccus tardaugens TaxID=2071624 RepID=UPI00100B24D1|nr:hypothetical protein [Halegenticoccus tardaugens]